MASVLSLINQGHPKAIGLDIVYPEPDRSSPHQIAEFLASGNLKLPDEIDKCLLSLPDHDQILAKALLETPTVLGYPFAFTKSVGSFNSCEPERRPSRFALIGADPAPWLFEAVSSDANLPLLEKSAKGSGFLNVLANEDGIVRNIPLVMNYLNELYPSLIVEMLRVGEGISTIQVRSTKNGIEAVRIGSHIVPTDAYGQMRIRYCGPSGSFPYISVIDLLNGKINTDIFRDAYVFVGSSALGLGDTMATPTSSMFPGIEIHAHSLNTIISDSYLLQPDWSRGAELVYLLFISIILIAFLPISGAVRSGVYVLVLSIGMGIFSRWNFVHNGYFVDVVYPFLSTGLLFTVLTFAKYLIEEREKTQIRRAFSKYLSPVVVNELLHSPEQLTLSGEEREITVLFSDIRNFTSLSEKMIPDELCTFLNEYLTSMTQILMDNRATVDKFIGDEIMAFWNAPLYDMNHSKNACLASLQMIRSIEQLNREWESQGKNPITFGIGLHTGIARVGNMGSEQRFDYTVMGDTVNIASRLQEATRLYNVTTIVSETTHSLVKNQGFVFRELDKIRVMGKENPVTIFELIEEQTRVSSNVRQGLESHHKALAAYYAGEFETAHKRFKQLAGGPHGTLYQLYMKRCRAYLKNPPPQPWKGITTLKTK